MGAWCHDRFFFKSLVEARAKPELCVWDVGEQQVPILPARWSISFDLMSSSAGFLGGTYTFFVDQYVLP